MNDSKRNKRIAIVTPYGAEPRLDNYAEFVLAQELGARGYDVSFYTYASRQHGYKDGMYKGVRVVRCRERHGFSPRLIFEIFRTRPRIVLALHPRSLLNFSAYWAARIAGARFIVEIVGILHDPFIVSDTDDPHGNEYTDPKLIMRFTDFLKRLGTEKISHAWKNYIFHMPTAHADEIISINKDEETHVRRVYGRSSNVIYWAAPLPSHGERKPAASIPENFIFFIGQMKRRKGWDTAIEVIAELHKTGDALHLVCVGPHDTRKAEEYATELGVRERITFLSGISNEERNWLYAHAACALIPSRYEGFGLPVFEAFVASTPVCATDIPVFKEFLTDRANALLFQVGNAVQAAQSIRELLSNQALRTTLIREGSLTAESFSRERMTNEYIQLIEK